MCTWDDELGEMSWRWWWWPVGRWCCCGRSSYSLLFLRCFFFCHLASLLLLPSGGSKRKVGGGAAAGMMSLDRWAGGDAGDPLGGGVAAVALPLLCCFCVASSLFVSFVPSVNNVLPSLQRLRGGAGGGGLGSWFWPVDGYSSSSLRVFSAVFPFSVSVFPPCFLLSTVSFPPLFFSFSLCSAGAVVMENGSGCWTKKMMSWRWRWQCWCGSLPSFILSSVVPLWFSLSFPLLFFLSVLFCPPFPAPFSSSFSGFYKQSEAICCFCCWNGSIDSAHSLSKPLRMKKVINSCQGNDAVC